MPTYNDGGDYIKTSIRGRRLGLDNNGALRGNTGYGRQIEYLTTVGTDTLYPCGFTVMNTTAQSTGFQLTPPSAQMVGIEKKITSMAAYTTKISLASGAFGTSTGAAAATVLTSTGLGQSVILQYVSTSVVQVVSNTGTITFSSV